MLFGVGVLCRIAYSAREERANFLLLIAGNFVVSVQWGVSSSYKYLG